MLQAFHTHPYPCLVKMGNTSYYSPSADSANKFINNYMEGGFYGFYMYYYTYYTAARAFGNVISNNTIKDVYYMGVMAYYQYGFTFTNNKLNIGDNGYGLYNYYGNNATSASGSINLIANNFISIPNGNSYAYGMLCYYNEYTKYLNNNIYIGNTSTYAYDAYFYTSSGTSVVMYNNNYVNTGGGYAIYVGGSSMDTSDYNNFYVTGSNMGSYNGSAQATLADWQSTTSDDANSMSVKPGYLSKTNLHIMNAMLNGKGKWCSETKKDIDGDVRNTSTPDIGADEIFPPATDAGVYTLDSPAYTGCGGTRDVWVTVANYGTGTLTSFKVNWSVNGTAQTAYSYSSSTGITIGQMLQVKLGSYTFTTGSTYAMKFYTSSPNGLSTDPNPSNDTIAKSMAASGLTGTYSIGTSGTWTTFTAAVADLTTKGVCGAIVINVDDNTYTESIDVTAIPGTTATKTVTFQSKNNDSSKVILDWALTSSYGAGNYALRLNGCSYVIFKKMTIQRSTGGNYGNAIEITGSATYNTVTNCEIRSVYSGAYSFLVYSSTAGDEYNAFRNNLLYNSYYGVYCYHYGTIRD
ncbi:MAG: right-handed parallel beta-helix repeat-containing protein [Bacteroidetes bacterium]|nr:right-handed parallel beta-helix repeat-containing protein [Bacteroidota bacterium]